MLSANISIAALPRGSFSAPSWWPTITIKVAELKDGLLSIDLEQPQPERVSRRIEIAGG